MTVPRDALVEWWPLVDVAKLNIGVGDVVILRTNQQVTMVQAERMREEWARVFPGAKAVLLSGSEFDVAYRRPAREIRDEDLEQPEPKRTME